MTPHDAGFVLGIDIGGTCVRSGLVATDGQMLAHAAAALPPGGDPERLSQVVAEQARRISLDADAQPAVVGVALPGVWDQHSGVMQTAVNLPKLVGVDLRSLFTKALGRPVRLETDVNAAGWAQWQNTRPRPERFAYVSLGTGVGGCVILDGELLRHTHGGAGHFGFLIVDTSAGAPAGHAAVPGCLEAVLRKNVGKWERGNGANEDLPSNAAQGQLAHALAVAAAQLAHLYAPDLIAFGGGVIEHHPELLARTRDAFSQYRGELIPPSMRIERAPLESDEAGVIGAALLAARAGNQT